MERADLGLGLVMLGAASTLVAYFGLRPAAIIFLVLAVAYTSASVWRLVHSPTKPRHRPQRN